MSMWLIDLKRFLVLILEHRLIFDLSVRLSSLVEHYTNFGVLPLGFYFEEFGSLKWISLHALNGNILFESRLFLIFLYLITLYESNC